VRARGWPVRRESTPKPPITEPTWEVQIDEVAPPGNVVPALARLLLGLAREQLRHADDAGRGDTAEAG